MWPVEAMEVVCGPPSLLEGVLEGKKGGGGRERGLVFRRVRRRVWGVAWGHWGPLWFYLPHQGDDFRMVLHFFCRSARFGPALLVRREGRKEREKHYSHNMQMMCAQ